MTLSEYLASKKSTGIALPEERKVEDDPRWANAKPLEEEEEEALMGDVISNKKGKKSKDRKQVSLLQTNFKSSEPRSDRRDRGSRRGGRGGARGGDRKAAAPAFRTSESAFPALS
eukprot:GCRY01000215.1.p3 GENE.GCRY01000215.1~~GCRY01000215.1.p3  ORF type:complete len:115 (+),score=38.75 GCRY01000215.1:545-889(+)